MKIDVENGNVLNTKEISIHDSILKEMVFDYKTKKLLLVFDEFSENNQEILIEYHDVIGFGMISSDFWGKSPHIHDWEFIDKERQIIVNNLLDEKERYQYKYSRIEENKKYIETMMTFISGDKLLVACEYILFFEERMRKLYPDHQ